MDMKIAEIAEMAEIAEITEMSKLAKTKFLFLFEWIVKIMRLFLYTVSIMRQDSSQDNA